MLCIIATSTFILTRIGLPQNSPRSSTSSRISKKEFTRPRVRKTGNAVATAAAFPVYLPLDDEFGVVFLGLGAAPRTEILAFSVDVNENLKFSLQSLGGRLTLGMTFSFLASLPWLGGVCRGFECSKQRRKCRGEELHVEITRVRKVRPEGFEPPTLGSEDRCAIQLRHGRFHRRKLYCKKRR